MTATVLTAIESAIEPSECSNGTEDVLALETEDCSEKNHLLTSFTDTTFQYTQIDRVGNIAFFTQTHKKSGIVRYEVVVIDIQPVHTFPNGITTPEHEAYPSSSQWGSKGWTMYTEAGAREKIRWL